jgi:hypothetical protein
VFLLPGAAVCATTPVYSRNPSTFAAYATILPVEIA